MRAPLVRIYAFGIPAEQQEPQLFGELLTVLWRSVDHVELVDLFGVVLRLRVVLPAALLPVPLQLLQQLLGAVVQRLDLIGDLAGSLGVRGAR